MLTGIWPAASKPRVKKYCNGVFTIMTGIILYASQLLDLVQLMTPTHFITPAATRKWLGVHNMTTLIRLPLLFLSFPLFLKGRSLFIKTNMKFYSAGSLTSMGVIICVVFCR